MANASDGGSGKMTRSARKATKKRLRWLYGTPGLAGGRPLKLAVLSDFKAVTDDEEREQAVNMAWATLVPLIRATGSTKDLK